MNYLVVIIAICVGGPLLLFIIGYLAYLASKPTIEYDATEEFFKQVNAEHAAELTRLSLKLAEQQEKNRQNLAKLEELKNKPVEEKTRKLELE